VWPLPWENTITVIHIIFELIALLAYLNSLCNIVAVAPLEHAPPNASG